RWGYQGKPIVQRLPRKKTNGRTPRRCTRAAPESRPSNLTRKGDLVEPLAAVITHPSGQDTCLPRCCGRFEPSELSNYLEHTPRTIQTMLLRNVLPCPKKAQKIRSSDW